FAYKPTGHQILLGIAFTVRCFPQIGIQRVASLFPHGASKPGTQGNPQYLWTIVMSARKDFALQECRCIIDKTDIGLLHTESFRKFFSDVHSIQVVVLILVAHIRNTVFVIKRPWYSNANAGFCSCRPVPDNVVKRP